MRSRQGMNRAKTEKCDRLCHPASSRLGIEAWKEVVSTAGLQGKTYLPVALYPDAEMEALLRAAESATGLRRDDLLADFGEWVIGPLIDMYQAMIPAGWDAMTFLLNMQQIHERILRLKDPAATAPKIQVHKRGDDTLEIHYLSQRPACSARRRERAANSG